MSIHFLFPLKVKESALQSGQWFLMCFFLSQLRKIPENNRNLYYCSAVTGQRTKTFNIWQITDTKAISDTGHMINSSSCGIYSTLLVPHPSTILRGRCLPSAGDMISTVIKWANYGREWANYGRKWAIHSWATWSIPKVSPHYISSRPDVVASSCTVLAMHCITP